MEELLHTLNVTSLNALQQEDTTPITSFLESGKIIYLPSFALTVNKDEQPLLSESILAPKHKNISYDYTKKKLNGVNEADEAAAKLKSVTQHFMHRYAEFARALVDTLFPQYQQALQWGRTSYRPAEIHGRPTSKRKDDTRLHVDSFPATPVNGLRILRIFCNINPHGTPRVWHIGEPFPTVLEQFADEIPKYSCLKAHLLKLIKATKTLRSPYDHYMLQLHDRMKLADNYQQKVSKYKFEFPSNSTWIVFTDQVSHAALSGQYLLEQTFYLPTDAMQTPALSPLAQWKKKKPTCFS